MWVQAYHNAEGKEEFGDKPFLTMPKKGFCDFMSTTYKERFYDKIKDYSNLPHPDECPVTKVSDKFVDSKNFLNLIKFQKHFSIKNYPFDGEKYKALAKPGMWRIDLFLSQDHEDSHATKIGVSIFASVTKSE